MRRSVPSDRGAIAGRWNGRCELEARIKPQVMKVERSDTDVWLALEHAARRATRSVSCTIETASLVRR